MDSKKSTTSSPQFSTQRSIVDLKAITQKFFVTKAQKERSNPIEIETEDYLLDKIDLPPNVDNYRDLMSVNFKAAQKRPTLQELQVKT